MAAGDVVAMQLCDVNASWLQCIYVCDVNASWLQCIYVCDVNASWLQCVYICDVNASWLQCIYVWLTSDQRLDSLFDKFYTGLLGDLSKADKTSRNYIHQLNKKRQNLKIKS